MSHSVARDNGLSSEWLTTTFPIETRRIEEEVVPIGWKVGSRLDGGAVTCMRILEIAGGEFIAEFAQGECFLEEIQYSSGFGIVLESREHLDQLVAAMRLEYCR